MLVEKKYPLTPPTFSMMLEKKLQIDYESEMAYQLCKLIKKQLKSKKVLISILLVIVKILMNKLDDFEEEYQRIDELTKEKNDKGKGDKGKSDKGLIAESFDWDDEFVSLEDEGTIKFKAFMAIVEDEPSVERMMHDLDNGKVTLDQLLSKQIPGNIVKALGGKGRRKENNSKVLRTKADVSTSEPALMITSHFEDDNDNLVHLPFLPKLSRAEPSGASKSLISLSDLTANMADLTLNTTKRIKNSSDKVSQTYVIKKKTKPKPPAVQLTCLDKNALPSTEQLLLTLIEEVKGIKNQIMIPSNTSSSVSQVNSLKNPKQKVCYEPCKHRGMKNHLSDDCH
nr:hypothetical protein [Tanacetum cinerariifolium]